MFYLVFNKDLYLFSMILFILLIFIIYNNIDNLYISEVDNLIDCDIDPINNNKSCV
jgi:hypothetical protein